MGDFISREAAIDANCYQCGYKCHEKNCDVVDRIRKVPAADVRPVVRGEWIYHDDDILGLTCECPICYIEGMLNGNFCPNCGADMREGQNGSP